MYLQHTKQGRTSIEAMNILNG